MADCATRWRRACARPALIGLMLLVAVGCNRGRAPKVENKSDTGAEGAGADSSPPKPPSAAEARLSQPFAEATRPDPPAEAPRPPDTTVTNKSVGKIYTDVVRLWKEIPFVTADGKRVEYSATLETDLGPIELALLSDVAPNHVRNFVALARVGFYDGLPFDHLRHDVSDAPETKGRFLDLIEAGDPLGANDPEDHDSIGYWLKPETDPKLDHEEGSVGAVRGPEPDSAGCKFYIVLSKEPPIPKETYTIFGKVTKGLDVAHKIHEQPVVEAEQEVGYSRPLKPVVIRKVIIHTKEVDTPEANAENK
jgi:peptidyl-prolyl cis-trans isomerase B (cyclophilin B)